jgi:hypothetical protein
VTAANYCLQVSGPELVALEARLSMNSPPLKPSLSFNWNSSGKTSAINAIAALYAGEDARSGKKLGKISIAQMPGRSTLTPTFGNGSAEFLDIDSKDLSGPFLVCATYFDDTGKQYGQSFEYKVSAEIKQGQRVLFYQPPSSTTKNACGEKFPGRNKSRLCKIVNHLGL